MQLTMKIATIFILTLVSCLVQAETVDEAVADLNVKVTSVTTNIESIIQNSGELLAKTREVIRYLITQVQEVINEQKAELEDCVEEAKREASQNKVDITKCVNEVNEKLSTLDFNATNSCSNSPELDFLGPKLGLLGQIKRKVSGSVNRCLIQNSENVSGLRSCVETEINSAQEETGKIQNEISSTCENARRVAEVCVEENASNLDKSISGVAQNFRTCLSNIL